MNTAHDLVAEFFNPEAQMTLGQSVVLSSIIRASGDSPNVLVFGCGNDSLLWMKCNFQGHTLFIEDNRKWAKIAKQNAPAMNIEVADYAGRTVADSFPIDEAELSKFPVPECL
jgi:Polysaccharide biosynthesis